MDKVLGVIGWRVFGSIGKIVDRWQRFRNLTSLQRVHSDEPGFYKWHHQNYRWYHKPAA